MRCSGRPGWIPRRRLRTTSSGTCSRTTAAARDAIAEFRRYLDLRPDAGDSSSVRGTTSLPAGGVAAHPVRSGPSRSTWTGLAATQPFTGFPWRLDERAQRAVPELALSSASASSSRPWGARHLFRHRPATRGIAPARLRAAAGAGPWDRLALDAHDYALSRPDREEIARDLAWPSRHRGCVRSRPRGFRRPGVHALAGAAVLRCGSAPTPTTPRSCQPSLLWPPKRPPWRFYALRGRRSQTPSSAACGSSSSPRAAPARGVRELPRGHTARSARTVIGTTVLPFPWLRGGVRRRPLEPRAAWHRRPGRNRRAPEIRGRAARPAHARAEKLGG